MIPFRLHRHRFGCRCAGHLLERPIRLQGCVARQGVTRAPYTEPMSQQSPLEDWRGVDVGQIRDLLAMSVEERVRHMVEVANTFIEIRENAKRFKQTTTS